jgi:phosphoribosylaminoimidazolecarboxamide formyltransferase/IMP cyclohydrolase
VGGPTMVRAAAKNHAHVGVVVDPAEYSSVLDELRREGQLGTGTRRRLARAAFAHTAAYDAAIVAWLDDGELEGGPLPPTIHLALEQAQELRYGENPHQRAARYKSVGTTGWWDEVVQHSGMALSYLNLFDADAAWALVHDLGGQPAAAIIKHANPCGAAVADDAATAYHRAFECDPMSAFGGIVALNRPVGDDLAEEMVANAKADVVIAPGYTASALDLLATRRKNTRRWRFIRRAMMRRTLSQTLPGEQNVAAARFKGLCDPGEDTTVMVRREATTKIEVASMLDSTMDD